MYRNNTYTITLITLILITITLHENWVFLLVNNILVLRKAYNTLYDINRQYFIIYKCILLLVIIISALICERPTIHFLIQIQMQTDVPMLEIKVNNRNIYNFLSCSSYLSWHWPMAKSSSVILNSVILVISSCTIFKLLMAHLTESLIYR